MLRILTFQAKLGLGRDTEMKKKTHIENTNKTLIFFYNIS
jgi:hypothetical protein